MWYQDAWNYFKQLHYYYSLQACIICNVLELKNVNLTNIRPSWSLTHACNALVGFTSMHTMTSIVTANCQLCLTYLLWVQVLLTSASSIEGRVSSVVTLVAVVSSTRCLLPMLLSDWSPHGLHTPCAQSHEHVLETSGVWSGRLGVGMTRVENTQ